MKLWEKDFSINSEIERFTVGRDREMDLYLAPYDVLGSMAHITMLESIGLLKSDELQQLLAALRDIHALCMRGKFVIEDDVEDVHSQVELMLTRQLGDMGKKIHSGRSRNDQVLVDLKLFTRQQLKDIADDVMTLFGELIAKSEQYKDVLMPGYTHLQVAMPSSFGLWFGLSHDQPQSLGKCRRLWQFVPPRPYDDHSAAGFRLHGLQRGVCPDGKGKDGAQRGVCHGDHRRNGGQAGL